MDVTAIIGLGMGVLALLLLGTVITTALVMRRKGR